MSERLSAAEVVEKLREEAGEYAALQKPNDRYKGIAAGYCWSADFVQSHLVPQWQAEPTGDGWYWVRSSDGRLRVCRVAWSIKRGWLCEGAGGSRPLNGRRVCPISGPPSDAKGGA